MEGKTLGTQIAFYRKNKAMTQDTLAKALDVTNQAVSKWESNLSCPDVYILPKLAEIFGISIDALFGRQPDAPIVEDLPWEEDGVLRAVLYMGKKLLSPTILDHYRKEAVEFRYDGPALSIISDFSVTCLQDVSGNISAGDVTVNGNVGGNISTCEGINCGNVGGSICTSNGINCRNVSGDVIVRDGGMNCGDVGGNLKVTGDVSCNYVAGSVTAGGKVDCQKIEGSVYPFADSHILQK